MATSHRSRSLRSLRALVLPVVAVEPDQDHEAPHDREAPHDH